MKRRVLSLIGVGEAAVYFQVGTGRMPAQSKEAQEPRKKVAFNPAETSELAAFVGSLAPGPAVPDAENYASDGDMQEGGQIFRTNCASCHSDGQPLYSPRNVYSDDQMHVAWSRRSHFASPLACP